MNFDTGWTSTNEGNEEGGEGTDATAADLLGRVIVITCVILVAGMLGYVLWQATVTPPAADPVATVEAVESMPGADQQRVTVSLENRGETGLTSIQVGVRCGGLDRSLEFEHVPANGHRTGTVVCPTGTDPEASVETWIGV